MAIRTDKFMYLDMEFYDSSAFGFINFYNNQQEGENLAAATLGFGNVEERRIGIYGTEHVDKFEIENFNNIEVHNYNKEMTEYYDSNFIVKANNFKLSLQNTSEIAVINFHTDTLNDYVKIEEEKNEDEEIIVEEEKWNFGNPNGMLISAIGTIGLTNTNNKMFAAFDMINEEFTWMGNSYSKDYFNLDGIKVSYEDHIHEEHYTKEEINEIMGDSVPIYEENGFYRYDLTNNVWNKIDYISVDEVYDIPDDAQDDTFWWSEKEQRLSEKRNSNLYTISISEEVETISDLPTPIDGELAYSINNQRHYEYQESNNYWYYTSPDEPILTRVYHKSDIDLSTINIGDIFYITSTDKIYEYDGTELIENRPNSIYIDDNNLPRRQTDKIVYKVKGGTFYMYDGSYWREIDKPMDIPIIHYSDIDKYESRNKVVFVTRRK